MTDPTPSIGVDGSHESLTNPDIQPTSPQARTWNLWHFAALWVGMAVCIPSYTLASGLITKGMNWWQAIVTISLANVIVLIPMVLNAHAGTKYGIPFPVFARASFGVLGANIPAMMRALVACGWFGIQTWIGGDAIYAMAYIAWPGIADLPSFLPGQPDVAAAATEALLPGTGPLLCFLLFWLINVYFIWKGTESIKVLETWAAPFLIVIGLALLGWAVVKADGFGPILATPSQFEAGQPLEGKFWATFFPSLTAMVGFWATLSLNIPDFTRYARSQRDQVIGQALGLPTTMALYAFIGAAVTSATMVIFGAPIWNPVELMTRFESPVVVAISMVALSIATLSTNIAANVVSPANDFSNLSPRRISFKLGGYITAGLGIAIFPWKLYGDPTGYIYVWLIGYSALLGPIGGVLIADYFAVRRCQLVVADLYRRGGIYEYRGGFNWRALVALALGVAPSLPGFLQAVKAVDAHTFIDGLIVLYDYAWFVGFAVAFVAYWALTALTGGAKARAEA